MVEVGDHFRVEPSAVSIDASTHPAELNSMRVFVDGKS